MTDTLSLLLKSLRIFGETMSTHNKMKSQLGDEEKMLLEGKCHTIMGICQNPDLLIPTKKLVRKK